MSHADSKRARLEDELALKAETARAMQAEALGFVLNKEPDRAKALIWRIVALKQRCAEISAELAS